MKTLFSLIYRSLVIRDDGPLVIELHLGCAVQHEYEVIDHHVCDLVTKAEFRELKLNWTVPTLFFWDWLHGLWRRLWTSYDLKWIVWLFSPLRTLLCYRILHLLEHILLTRGPLEYRWGLVGFGYFGHLRDGFRRWLNYRRWLNIIFSEISQCRDKFILLLLLLLWLFLDGWCERF